MVPYFRKKDGKDIVYGIVSYVILIENGVIKEIVSEDLSSACDGPELPEFVGGYYEKSK